MNILNGDILPDSGNIDIGQTVKVGYYSQGISNMDMKQRVIEYIRGTSEYAKTSEGEKINSSNILEKVFI